MTTDISEWYERWMIRETNEFFGRAYVPLTPYGEFVDSVTSSFRTMQAQVSCAEFTKADGANQEIGTKDELECLARRCQRRLKRTEEFTLDEVIDAPLQVTGGILLLELIESGVSTVRIEHTSLDQTPHPTIRFHMHIFGCECHLKE